jgi:hypothetical protein
MKAKIKRCIRIKENTSLEEYTGFIFVSNQIIHHKNTSKTIKLNITKFFTNNKNAFFLVNKYLCENVDPFLKQEFSLMNNDVLDKKIIYKKDKKIVYLIYLNFKTKFENNYSFLNMYTIENLKKKKDLYHCLYRDSKKRNVKNYKIVYDEENYLTINLKNIYYYLIGNDYTNIHLNKYIDI